MNLRIDDPKKFYEVYKPILKHLGDLGVSMIRNYISWHFLSAVRADFSEEFPPHDFSQVQSLVFDFLEKIQGHIPIYLQLNRENKLNEKDMDQLYTELKILQKLYENFTQYILEGYNNG